MVHRALFAIRNNGVSAFQGEVYTGRIGPIVGTSESVRIIEVSAFQGCPQGGVPLYIKYEHEAIRIPKSDNNIGHAIAMDHKCIPRHGLM